MQNGQETDSRIIPVASAAPRQPTNVVCLSRYRLAQKIAETGRRQGELAQLLRAASQDREQLADALRGAQHRLLGIADNYRQMLQRLDNERHFREACRAAAELSDLDEMIRRRDELARQLDALRHDDIRRSPAAD